MTKTVDKLKKHLVEIADAVNSFKSETVQVKVITRVIDNFAKLDHSEPAEALNISPNIAARTDSGEPDKKSGLTKIINQELQAGFFETPLTLGEITEQLAEKYESKFYTYQTSGILLGLIKKGKLIRQAAESNGKFVYSKPPVS
jgi:hypothetical protein